MCFFPTPFPNAPTPPPPPLILFDQSLNDFSNDCIKPFRTLQLLFIFVLGAGTGCCFFVLRAGIGLCGEIGLSSKYCINCRTIFPGVGIGVFLPGAVIRRASSLILTRVRSSLIVIPDNNLLTNSLQLLFILLLHI